MNTRRRSAVAVAAVGTAAMAAAALVGAAPATATSASSVPVVVVHMSSNAIRLSTGTHLHAGTMQFKVESSKGGHALQIARLHKGYTLAEAGADLNKAFSGDTAAIARVDHNITFLGGAAAAPQKPGMVGVTLRAGRFLLIDQNSPVHTFIDVTGKTVRRPLAHNSTITAYTYGFETSSPTLPKAGNVRMVNSADQPHFVVLQRIKEGTTAAQVRRAFSHPSQGNPPWALRATAETGVASPQKAQVVSYSLPAGEYLIACFWPDIFTGMPHAFMGMWKIVHLK